MLFRCLLVNGIALFLFNLQAQTFFGNQKEISQSTSGFIELKHFDLDNDGLQDLLCSSTKNDRVVWYKNLGNGEFGNQNLIYTYHSHHTQSVHAGDINNDGLLDVVFCSENYNEVRWAENLGNGLFSPAQVIPSFLDDPVAVYTADIDGDGDDDVLTADQALDQIVWFESLGNGAFASSQHVITTNTNDAKDVFAADMDGDGDIDVLSASGLDDKLAWFENLGGGVFGTEHIISTNSDFAKAIVAADFNNDGAIDIVASSFNDTKIVWFENLGGGSFGTEMVISNTALDIHDINVSDVNNDGFNDVLAASMTDNHSVWFANTGTGSFGSEQIISSFSHGATSVIAFDSNNNGFADVFTGSRFSGQIEKNENLGGGVFGPLEVVSASAGDPRSAQAVDVDNDGDLDLVCVRTGNTYSSGVYAGTIWYENIGCGEFAKQRTLVTDAAMNIRLADLDDDNLKDLITIGMGTGKLLWYKNLGGGNFSSEIELSNTVPSGKGIFTIDLDQDGDTDVLSASDDKIAWYENYGMGTFGPEQIITLSASGASYVYSTDFDGDGDLDVLASLDWSNKFVWYENTGNVQFGTAQILLNVGVNFPQLIDFDGDNDLDLVHTVSGIIQFYENTGNQAFVLSASVSANNGTPFYLADVDADSDLDLFLVESVIQSSWRKNNGGLNFSAPEPISDTMQFPNGIIVADLDNDGDLDPITLSAADDLVSWNENLQFENTLLSGKVFLDLNNNQIQDSTEPGVANHSIFSIPQSDFTFTQSSGNYFLNLSDSIGNYQIQPESIPNWSISTDSLTYNVSIGLSCSNLDSLDFGLTPISNVTDLEADLTASVLQCGGIINYWLTVNNIGTTLPSGVICLSLDDSLNYLNSTFPPDSIIGQNVYWSFDSLSYFGTEQINLQVLAPDLNSAGDTLSDTLSIFTFDSNNNLQLTQSDTLSQVVTCSPNPYDKITTPEGVDSLGYLNPMPDEIEYTIRFQNIGNDTVEMVLVEDQLDTNLVWSTLNPVAASHNYTTTVDQNGMVTFVFDSIMLPDSSTNYLASQGFITYRIDVKSNLPSGTTIRNFADIYFDQNSAVTTNTTHHTLYECSEISFNVLETVCIGDTVFGQVDVIPSQINWEIIGEHAEFGENMSWHADTSGVFDLQLSVSNPICVFDSLLTIEAIPEIPATLLDTSSICYGDSLFIFGQWQAQTGLYTDSLQGQNGCDSIIQKQLIVLPEIPLTTLTSSTICYGDSLIIFGQWQVQTGLYTDSLQGQNGCDSIVQKQLIVLPEIITTVNDSISICEGDSALIYGSYKNVSGIYYDSLLTSNGCDSVVGTSLLVDTLPNVQFSLPGVDTICLNNSVIALNTGSPSGGVYSTGGNTIFNFDPNFHGIGNHTIVYSYTAANSCTAHDTSVIIVDGCLSIDAPELDPILEVNPNPFTKKTTIFFGRQLNGEYTLQIINALGKVIHTNAHIHNDFLEIDAGNWTPGVYYMRLSDKSDGKSVHMRRIIVI